MFIYRLRLHFCLPARTCQHTKVCYTATTYGHIPNVQTLHVITTYRHLTQIEDATYSNLTITHEAGFVGLIKIGRISKDDCGCVRKVV